MAFLNTSSTPKTIQITTSSQRPPQASATIDIMLNELQKKIYGQRNERLTPTEINRLFQSPITPEFNLTLYRALQRNAINPDVTILQAIPRAKTREYLIPIALCLRFKTDPNMYVDAPKLGTIHILGYVYSLLGGDKFSDDNDRFSGESLDNKPSGLSSIADENVLNTIVLMLVAKGSRPSLPMYDRKAGKIRTDGDFPSSSLSVVEWLNDQGYKTILERVNTGDPSDLQKFLDKESLTALSILLDMPSLIGRDYEPKDMLLSIRAFSPISFDKIPTPNTVTMMDYKSLDDSVTYLNSFAYDRLIKRGQMPSYLLINKILIGMKTYKNLGHIIAIQELETMLLSSISVGTQLDQDQLAIISTMGQDILAAVTKEYDQPYWRKICKAPNPPGTNSLTPEPLRRLAISLNIYPTMNKSAICDNINNLAKADKEALKEAARRRQQLRIAADMGTLNEFLGDKTPNLVCRNRSLLQQNPFDYNDIDLAYYRDDQGAVWCFSSETFSSILESGINPYNSTLLPDSFKEQLRYQIDVLRRLGIDANRGEIGIYSSRIPITFDKSIDSLTAKDIVSEASSEQALNLFIQLAGRNNLTPDTIRNLSKEQMMNALRSIDYTVNLAPLSTSHSLVTTSRIIEYLNRLDPDAVKNFFSSLNLTQDIGSFTRTPPF